MISQPTPLSIQSLVNKNVNRLEARKWDYEQLSKDNAEILYSMRLMNDALQDKDDPSIYRKILKLQLKHNEIIQSQLRLKSQIDNIVAVIAGYLAYALDLIINQDYDVFFKMWIKNTINKLSSLRQITDSETLNFSTASGILAPYLFKTKKVSSPERYAGIRNAIRKLIEI